MVLLVYDVVDAVPMDEEVLHAVPKVLGGVHCDEEELPGLGDHHHEAVESLSRGELLVDGSISEIAMGLELL